MEPAHRLEPGFHLGQQRLVLSIEFAWLRHHPIEALVSERQHAIGQVAPGLH
jgi:hypothetical protein